MIELLFVFTFATIIGLFFHQFYLTLLVSLFGLFIWHVYQQRKLANWLWQQKTLFPPDSIGSWNIIFYGLHKHQKRIRQRQNELAEIIKRFRHGSESIPDTLILSDLRGKIEWCNKMAQFLLNIRWPDDKGQNVINLIREPEFAHYIQAKNYKNPLTLLFNKKNYIEFRVIPYTENRWIIIARDVDQLYLAEKQRHDFFTNASHELRTPLTVVKSYVDMLSDDLVAADKQKQVFSVMQGQIERMESLIGQILTLSQIENSSIQNQLEVVDIPNILGQIQNNVIQIYSDYHFTFDIDDTLVIEGNKALLYSVVSNLIYNAIKHTVKGTRITIFWKKMDDQAYFSVTDTGKGIPAHHIHRLTERFYQVDSARTHQKNSAGLGLAIVKHALLKHGNTKLEIESEMGHGSKFSFLLPIHY